MLNIKATEVYGITKLYFKCIILLPSVTWAATILLGHLFPKGQAFRLQMTNPDSPCPKGEHCVFAFWFTEDWKSDSLYEPQDKKLAKDTCTKKE